MDTMHLGDLKQDQRNAKKHNERNLAAITTSITEVGTMRPMVAASDGTIIAGNATAEAFGDLGMEDVIVVRSDGTRPIVHIRTDVEAGSDTAVKAGLYDNLASDLSAGQYRPEVLAALLGQVDLAPVAMTANEAQAIIGAASGRESMEIDHSRIISGTGDFHEEREYPDTGFRDDRDSRYGNTLVRQIVLIMDRDQYMMTLTRLRVLAEQQGLETNGEVVRWMLDQHVPEADVAGRVAQMSAATGE